MMYPAWYRIHIRYSTGALMNSVYQNSVIRSPSLSDSQTPPTMHTADKRLVQKFSAPVLYLMWILYQAGYIMPRAPGSAPIPGLILQLLIVNVFYSVFQGLMYGTRSAIMMDVTNPRVAATQFTAY